MKVLVTGCRGQVGSALVGSAPAEAEVTGLSHAELDITDGRAVAQYVQHHQAHVIVNAAAYTAVDKAESEPEQAANVNVRGAAHLAQAARSIGARLIHLSTDFVFDGRGARPYAPGSPTGPLNVYGRTKLEGERAVLATLPERTVVLRTAWVYAAQGRNFVRTMLRLMRADAAVRVVNDQVGSPTSAVSLAQVIWRIIAREDLSGVHHCSDAGVASWYDLAVAIAEESPPLGLLSSEPAVTPIRTEDFPTPARRPAYSVLESSSLGLLGITPRHWRKALREVLCEIARIEQHGAGHAHG